MSSKVVPVASEADLDEELAELSKQHPIEVSLIEEPLKELCHALSQFDILIPSTFQKLRALCIRSLGGIVPYEVE